MSRRVQIRWAKWSLERARLKAGRGEAGRPLEHGDVLAQQLSHFVNTLHQFVMDRLLHGAWLELQQVGTASCCFTCLKRTDRGDKWTVIGILMRAVDRAHADCYIQASSMNCTVQGVQIHLLTSGNLYA